MYRTLCNGHISCAGVSVILQWPPNRSASINDRFPSLRPTQRSLGRGHTEPNGSFGRCRHLTNNWRKRNVGTAPLDGVALHFAYLVLEYTSLQEFFGISPPSVDIPEPESLPLDCWDSPTTCARLSQPFSLALSLGSLTIWCAGHKFTRGLDLPLASSSERLYFLTFCSYS